MRLLGFALVSLAAVVSVEACFLRSCLPSGKRSVDNAGKANPRYCTACMNGLGQCVSPTTCCGPEIGCHMGSWEASVCAEENDISTPCVVHGRTCGANSEGNCVADKLCCTADACAYEEVCAVKADKRSTGDKGDNLDVDELITLLERLKVRSVKQ